MTDINGTSTDALATYRTQTSNASSTQGSDELGQDQFMELLVAQLTNQNPLDPQENGDFIAELAQFSSVEGIDKLNTSVESMMSDYKSSQALQASSLVGRQVVVKQDTAYWSGEGNVAAMVDVPEGATNVMLSITNSAGALVGEIPMTKAVPGENGILWDGKDNEGNVLPAGAYKFKATGVVDEKAKTFEVYGSAKVNSVTLAGGDMMLNVAGVGKVPMSDIREIFE
ncbi:flagellar hook assembly protein FlgD [Litoribacillus peritrichatus]|uniref:Basal-body rod modification protein FlgD n=1 Tax=Litoribacillus peritrichatus TaxID=718191 RepID=A0ABP7M6Q7_9GAMM